MKYLFRSLFSFVQSTCYWRICKNNVIKLAVIMLQQEFKYNMLKIKFKQFVQDNAIFWMKTSLTQ